MIALARAAVPGADLRVGTLERLPWSDAAFDVVTGFNAFQFAPDMVAALAEAARVTRPGGRVAVCNWGGAGPQDLVAVTHDLQALGPGRGARAAPPDRRTRRAGGAARARRACGRRPAGDVAVPYAPPDRRTLERGMFAAGNLRHVAQHLGPEAAVAGAGRGGRAVPAAPTGPTCSAAPSGGSSPT